MGAVFTREVGGRHGCDLYEEARERWLTNVASVTRMDTEEEGEQEQLTYTQSMFYDCEYHDDEQEGELEEGEEEEDQGEPTQVLQEPEEAEEEDELHLD